MHTEYEVRILEIDSEDIKRRLEKANAKFEWDRLQKRYVYNFIPKIDGKWIRLRTNGDKTTLTMITCTKDNDYAQTVYISERVG